MTSTENCGKQHLSHVKLVATAAVEQTLDQYSISENFDGGMASEQGGETKESSVSKSASFAFVDVVYQELDQGYQ
ncbi:hypothetical protein VE03_08292, partial [Pseudogymnoascus sp. 23342-1-I1]